MLSVLAGVVCILGVVWVVLTIGVESMFWTVGDVAMVVVWAVGTLDSVWAEELPVAVLNGLVLPTVEGLREMGVLGTGVMEDMPGLREDQGVEVDLSVVTEVLGDEGMAVVDVR